MHVCFYLVNILLKNMRVNICAYVNKQYYTVLSFLLSPLCLFLNFYANSIN